MKYRIRLTLAAMFALLMAFQSGRVYEYAQTRELLNMGQQVNNMAVEIARMELPL